MINSDHRLAGPVPGQGLPVVRDFRSKARNKIPRLLNLDSYEVCDLRLQIETSNSRKFH